MSHIAGAKVRIVKLEPQASGTMEVVALTEVGTAAADFWFEDERGSRRALEVIGEEVSSLSRVNLVATSDRGSVWHLVDGKKATVSESDHEAYRIPGIFTYYVRSNKAAATAELLSPITGVPLSIQPLSEYVFRVRAATHRCNASFVVEIEAEDGNIVGKHSFQVDSKRKGGTRADDYQLIEGTIEVPADGHRLRIKLEKGETLKGDDSYVFVTLPELYGAHARSRGRAILLPYHQLEAVQNARLQLVSTTLRLWETHRADRPLAGNFTVCIKGEEAVREPIVFPPKENLWKLTKLRVDRGRASFSATSRVKTEKSAAASAKVKFGIFVDGQLSAAARAAPKDGEINLRITLADKHLDGLQHTIEVRALPSHESLGFTYAILPFHVTPWKALQQWAGPPLSVSASPAARHHLRAFRAWANAAHVSCAVQSPPLARLHDELLRGFQKRDAYPTLEFPKATEPLVSVVIPVHNRFEVTYYCLCSLLFAHTKVSFEVIVVDDGSTDTTTSIDRFVEGVEIIRNATAVGFVGSCNAGARAARGEYIVFLNNDTEVTAGWLDEMSASIDDFANVGLVGAKLVYPDGRLQEAGGIVWRTGNPWNVGRGGNANEPQFNYVREVDYASGAAIMLPRAVWDEVGGFSSEFAPGYFEDTDLAMKVHDSGRRVLYVPTAEVIHFEGQSAGTSTSSGMKRYQEINRPKFKRKWVKTFSSHAEEGVRPEREKDRGASFRVLFIDHRFPTVDADAGSYAAFQEIRLLQSLGAKVTFLPRSLTWMDRHTIALQRAGVECLFAPFVTDFSKFIMENVAGYDVVYVCRFGVAKDLLPVIREASPKTKIIFNLADLHFLRELREAAAQTPGYSFERVAVTRSEEMAVVNACDLTLSYSDVEISILQSHLEEPAKIARVPWVVDVPEGPPSTFESSKDVLFLGGFAHPPNIAAVEFFALEVMPQLVERHPGLVFRIIGSKPTPEVLALASDNVLVEGYVPSLDEAFKAARVFVVPLIAGAGLKGKVLEAMSRGTPMVLSPVAAEGTSLSHNNDCLIADGVEEWVSSVDRLYSDRELWSRLRANAEAVAKERFSFEAGQKRFREILERVDIFGSDGLCYTRSRPRYDL